RKGRVISRQLELAPLPAAARTLPLGPRVCSRCGRRGFLAIRGEWFCDWHTGPRLPADVARWVRSRVVTAEKRPSAALRHGRPGGELSGCAGSSSSATPRPKGPPVSTDGAGARRGASPVAGSGALRGTSPAG